MNITQLEGKHIKICKRSIKAMDENGKTCGVVTGLTKYKDAPLRVQEDFRVPVCRSGLWGNRFRDVMDHVFVDGSKLYYIHDTSHAEFYERNRKIIEKLPGELAYFKDYEQVVEKAAQYVTVIHAHICN